MSLFLTLTLPSTLILNQTQTKSWKFPNRTAKYLTTKLNQNPFSNPSKNYGTFINILTNIKQRILPKTRVKFNKNKHKKSQWMSRGILNSIDSKDKLCKKNW